MAERKAHNDFDALLMPEEARKRMEERKSRVDARKVKPQLVKDETAQQESASPDEELEIIENPELIEEGLTDEEQAAINSLGAQK